ncbi:CpsD/CapB family tyrosine-protein kinase [uncultured Clostridium sp.]|jgi:capsular exopolysaccharide synthesis family protein|uniref:CpsD/CapB family tyrosine-protein kinase n=1 Tax=uncultured Clostridium sp. TaxID=59620 RepID=UPI00260485B9|nr:CpsD/CapB family tyrosine-protein kinase [uncultured Clostridium sp.]
MFIVETDPKSIAAETYKTLRTNIQYSSYDRSLQVMVVTSTQPGEGKSTTAGNTALSLAMDGKKVLLIDCDLRKPSIHKKFSVSNTEGLTEVILGRIKLLETIKPYNTTLDILTSGKIPPNPSEMLGSENMKRLLKELKEHYDYIILDAPPILAVTDAQILSTRADGVIFVVKAGTAKKEQILQAKSQLDKVKAQIIGTVLNAVDTKDSKNQYYYYYGNDK